METRGSWAAVLMAALLACTTIPEPPKYPYVAPGAGVSALVLDNGIKTGWPAPFVIDVFVDGFRVMKAHGTTAGPSLKEGRWRLRLEPGSHQILIQGRTSGIYYFDPVVFFADTLPGREYVIRLRKQDVGWSDLEFSIEYVGWSRDESARWPRKSHLANALF